MKYILKHSLLLILLHFSFQSPAQDAKAIVNKANEILRGNSSYAEMTMTIVRPKWERTLRFKSWSKGNDFSLIYISSPAKEKGQVFLKREKDMWNWLPTIERMIKIPPSMMMQSWMGSDLTNDDLVRESSIVDDYEHRLLSTDSVNGYPCYKIELIPHEEAPVVWGRIVTWISQDKNFALKNEYYDEDGYLQNVENLSEIKSVGDRTIPTRFEMVPADKTGHKTILIFNEIKFEIPIKENFFSIQNMKRIR